MKPEDIQKLKDGLRALKWWSRNLEIPITGGELILFEKIVEDLLKLIENEDDK